MKLTAGLEGNGRRRTNRLLLGICAAGGHAGDDQLLVAQRVRRGARVVGRQGGARLAALVVAEQEAPRPQHRPDLPVRKGIAGVYCRSRVYQFGQPGGCRQVSFLPVQAAHVYRS
jgi:hypothetical protein